MYKEPTVNQDMPIRAVIFRAEASKNLGLGHMFRCLSFVESLLLPVDPHFVIRDVSELNKVTEPLLTKGWTIHQLPSEIDDRADAAETAHLAQKVQAALLVTDLCHREVIRDPMRLVNYHRALRTSGVPFVLSIEDCRMAAFASDAAVIWNSHNENELSKAALNGCQVMAGLRYFICHPQFTAAGGDKRAIREKARRVLVSIGGSDPKGLTAKVARALALFKHGTVDAKILLGKAAAPGLQCDIEMLCTSISGLEFLNFTDSMAELLLWADLAIVGEGLIKYEAAIMGVPSLMISQFDHDSMPIHDFLKIGCSHYLGAGDKLNESDIADAVKMILADHTTRVALSRAGRTALDGRGMERIYKEVLKDVLEEI
jgi:spore coat polysaccharide biosynthesis predicted glycosyltransferase SpsG